MEGVSFVLEAENPCFVGLHTVWNTIVNNGRRRRSKPQTGTSEMKLPEVHGTSLAATRGTAAGGPGRRAPIVLMVNANAAARVWFRAACLPLACTCKQNFEMAAIFRALTKRVQGRFHYSREEVRNVI